MLLEDYVGKLLYRHDCVIVPEWGGLVSAYKPASIHPVTHIMNPPSKALSFNQALTNNDGLLANEWAAGEKCSYEEAVQQIGSAVREMRANLEHHRAIDWEHIGVFQLGAEDQIVFKAHHEVNYLSDAFGLSVLRSPAIQREERKVVTMDTRDSVLPEATAKSSRRGWWRAAAVLVPLIGLASISYWQRDAVSSSVHAGILNFTATGPELYQPREERTRWEPLESAEVEDWWAIAHENAKPVVEVPVSTDVAEAEAQPVASGAYHVIAGCFSNEANADKLLAQLRGEGLPARRIGQTAKGLHIVTYASYASRREALQGLSQIKREHSAEAWLLKK